MCTAGGEEGNGRKEGSTVQLTTAGEGGGTSRPKFIANVESNCALPPHQWLVLPMPYSVAPCHTVSTGKHQQLRPTATLQGNFYTKVMIPHITQGDKYLMYVSLPHIISNIHYSTAAHVLHRWFDRKPKHASITLPQIIRYWRTITAHHEIHQQFYRISMNEHKKNLPHVPYDAHRAERYHVVLNRVCECTGYHDIPGNDALRFAGEQLEALRVVRAAGHCDADPFLLVEPELVAEDLLVERVLKALVREIDQKLLELVAVLEVFETF